MKSPVPLRALKRDPIKLNYCASLTICLRMILSDLPSPAEASTRLRSSCRGFAQAGNRYPLFGIMRKRPKPMNNTELWQAGLGLT
ncbi:MAG: hypothetical protein WAK67_12810, partial [Xanthobacteraceae bacterium]